MNITWNRNGMKALFAILFCNSGNCVSILYKMPCKGPSIKHVRMERGGGWNLSQSIRYCISKRMTSQTIAYRRGGGGWARGWFNNSEKLACVLYRWPLKVQKKTTTTKKQLIIQTVMKHSKAAA